MDSPNSTTAATATPASAKITATATTPAILTDSSPVQESPFLNYINNLSPIKVAHDGGAQRFAPLSSPSVIFTSPRSVPERATNLLQRSQLCKLSSAEVLANDDGSKKFVDHSNDLKESVSRLITDTLNKSDVRNSAQDQPGSSSGCVDEYITDPVDADCPNSVNSINPKAASKQAEEFPQGQFTVESKLGHLEEENHITKQPSNECQIIESDLPVDHAPENKQCDGLGTNIIQAHEDYSENAAATSHGGIQNTEQREMEAGQLQRGLSRRCLQFEEAQQKTTVNSVLSTDLMNNVNGSALPASTTELNNLDSSHMDLTPYSNKQMINLSELSPDMLPPRFSGKSPKVAAKPSGIGLHLNSIVNTPPMSHSAIASVRSTPTIISCHQGSEDRILETQDSLGASTGESFHTAESLNMLLPIGQYMTPLNKTKVNSDHAGNFEEFGQSSPTKKRRRKSSSIDGEGCKRCNCKKTKCLKLYCDCFAAGIYCAEPCACQGCFNRPEYEDTVLETRQLIESRNPLAFAPKIVELVTDFGAANKEDINRSMSSLSRHKRGCNCKKSMCLKKYCECYQANVGCSSECRCEGCKNVYGRKEEYGVIDEIATNGISEERLEGSVDDKLAMVITNKDLLHAQLYDPHNLMPSTPSFLHSDHGKGAPKSGLICSRYVPSPGSDFPILSPYAKSTRSPRNSHSNGMILETSKEIVDVGSCGQGVDYNISEMMGQFSPKCSTLADAYDLTPSRNPSSVTIASSASSKTTDWTTGSRFQLCHGSGRLSSGRSLRWRGSPITPMTRLGETKNQRHDSDCGLCNIYEDDTPEILKEASTPVASVKASSPYKKRVSPPHNHINDFRSSSSGALRSGRRFILKSVPSFPPLTLSEGIKEEKRQQ